MQEVAGVCRGRGMNPPVKLPLVALALGVAVFVGSLVQLSPQLPERPATHFDAEGKADGWMSRGGYVGLTAVLGLGVPALLLCWAAGMRRLPPRLLKVPHAAFWRSPEYYPEACALVLRWAVGFGAANLLCLTLLHALVVEANRRNPPHLDAHWAWMLVGGYVAVALGSVAALYLQFKKAPGGR